MNDEISHFTFSSVSLSLNVIMPCNQKKCHYVNYCHPITQIPIKKVIDIKVIKKE